MLCDGCIDFLTRLAVILSFCPPALQRIDGCLEEYVAAWVEDLEMSLSFRIFVSSLTMYQMPLNLDTAYCSQAGLTQRGRTAALE
jgi:hypothetical protein